MYRSKCAETRIVGVPQPGKPNQGIIVERFKQMFCHKVPVACLFESLEEVCEIRAEWMLEYHEEKPCNP